MVHEDRYAQDAWIAACKEEGQGRGQSGGCECQMGHKDGIGGEVLVGGGGRGYTYTL